MWVLESSKDSGIKFYLLEGESCTVGRKDCKILIPNDNSVSRRHATLTVTHSDAHLSKPDVKPTLTMADSSKFGSLRNGNKVAGGSNTVLEDGDTIVFGATKSNQWRVVYKPLVVAVSSLQSAEKKSLKVLIRRLGGHMVPEWSKDCTHLVMTQLTVTIKVIGALVTGRPIVTPAFLQRLEKAVISNTHIPDPADFQPSIAEAAISEDDVSFKVNPDRKTLFKDKTVIFLSQKQFKQLGHTVELAGGKPLLIEEGPTSHHKKLLVDPNTLVMYADPEDQSHIMTQPGQEWVKDVMDILKRKGLRPIPQSEFGLAVLYASTDIHCNPKVAQAGLNLLHPVAAPSLPTQDVLASETQHTEFTQSHSTTRHKTDKERNPQESVQVLSKKRVRDEDTAKAGSPSKIQRRESGMPPPRPPVLATQETSPGPAKTSHQPESPELPYVGKQGLRLQDKEFLGAKNVSGTASKVKSNIVQAEKQKTLKGASNIDEERTGGETDGNGEDSPLEDIISPSERIDKSISKNRNGCEGRKSRHTVLSEPKTAKDEMLEMGDSEDVIPPSGGDVSRRTGKRRMEDLFAMETEDDKDEMGSWPELEMQGRRRKKRQVIEENDETRDDFAAKPRATSRHHLQDVPSGYITANKALKNDETRDDFAAKPRATSRHHLQDVPSGYITANKALKSEPTSPQDPSLPSNLAVVEQVVLLCRRPVLNGTHTAGRNGAKVNFKKFKKASYAGQFSMPRIIGGSDLEHHEIGHIKEAEDMMEQERETHRVRNKEKDLADKLFDWDPRPAKRRR